MNQYMEISFGEDTTQLSQRIRRLLGEGKKIISITRTTDFFNATLGRRSPVDVADYIIIYTTEGI